MIDNNQSATRLSSTALTALFLQPALSDSLQDFHRTLSAKKNISTWDAIVITASNKSQACGYEKQIAYRKEQGLLPVNTDVIIVPDEGDARIGSGGSTLSVLRTLKERYGDYTNKRFLCIHAGGLRCSQRCNLHEFPI